MIDGEQRWVRPLPPAADKSFSANSTAASIK